MKSNSDSPNNDGGGNKVVEVDVGQSGASRGGRGGGRGRGMMPMLLSVGKVDYLKFLSIRKKNS